MPTSYSLQHNEVVDFAKVKRLVLAFLEALERKGLGWRLAISRVGREEVLFQTTVDIAHTDIIEAWRRAFHPGPTSTPSGRA